MITIDCPWCEEDVATVTDDGGAFACPQCAVSEPIMPEPAAALEAAA